MPGPMLFEPISIRDVTLKNRVVVAPMHQYSAVNGFATDWHLMNVGRYAAGGAGLVFMESTKVERRGCGTVGDLGRWLERRAAFPRAEAPRLAPRVAELDARHRIVPADEVDAALEAGNVRVVPDAEIADRAAAPPLDLGRFHDHQPCAARRIAAGIHQVPVGREALVRGILVHRRHDHAILQGQAADLYRFKQQWRHV